jgi:hypothetical protein
MILVQEFMRFQRLTNERYTIAEPHGFMDVARDDAHVD